MSWMITGMRRAVWLGLIGAAGGALWSWQRDRATPSGPPEPPEWPPLTPVNTSAGTETGTTTGTTTSTTTETSSTSSGGTTTGGTTGAASFVNALVDAPEARSNQASGGWVLPNDDGECPDTHPIKANNNSCIYHVPGGRFYKRTKAERCYATAAEATSDGYRAAKA